MHEPRIVEQGRKHDAVGDINAPGSTIDVEVVVEGWCGESYHG
jgi:hypothetical protein